MLDHIEHRYDADMWFGYLEQSLTPEERAEFEKFLQDDEQLRRFVDKLSQDRALLRQLPPEPVPADLMANLEIAIAKAVAAEQLPEKELEIFVRKSLPFPKKLALMGALAVAALIVVGVLVFIFSGSSANSQPLPIVQNSGPKAPGNAQQNPTSPGHPTAPNPVLHVSADNGDYVTFGQPAAGDAPAQIPPAPEAAVVAASNGPIAAPVMIRINSGNPEASQVNLSSWAAAHQATVSADGQTQPSRTYRRVVLVIRGHQFAQLLSHLHRDNQSVDIVQITVQFARPQAAPPAGPNGTAPEARLALASSWSLPAADQSVPIFDDQAQVALPVVFSPERSPE